MPPRKKSASPGLAEMMQKFESTDDPNKSASPAASDPDALSPVRENPFVRQDTVTKSLTKAKKVKDSRAKKASILFKFGLAVLALGFAHLVLVKGAGVPMPSYMESITSLFSPPPPPPEQGWFF